MRTETVTRDGLSVTVAEANAKINFKRVRLTAEARRQANATLTAGASEATPTAGRLDPDEYALLVFMYPPMMASVVAHSGFDNWPAGGDLPPADFLALNDEFFTMWEQAVYTINRHWFNVPAGETELKKTPPMP